MSDYVYSGNIELAEILFSNGQFGAARVEYETALRKESKKPIQSAQRIDYLKRKIEECLHDDYDDD